MKCLPFVRLATALGVVALPWLGCSGDAAAQGDSLVQPAVARVPGKVYGICFGLDAYPGGNALPNCVNDAKDMHALLRKNGVPDANLTVLLDRQCTRSGMLAALAKAAQEAKAGDEVLVYFSGHGSQKKDENGDEPDGADETWVTIELDQILDDELDQAFQKIAGTVYVISDSCHSGTVSKDIEVGDAADDLGKYLPPAAIEKALGKPPGFTPRDIGVERRQRQEQQNANGGTATADGCIGARARLFSACSDGEVSNASRRERNSAFTGQLLGVLGEVRGQQVPFGQVCQLVTARLRNRAYRYPQNPTLFQLQPTLPVPAWLGGTGQTVEATAQRTTALAESSQRLVGAAVEGLLRREDVAPNSRRDWIASFGTPSGKAEARTGDELQLTVRMADKAPPRAWLCIVNVGPTGNMTLLYPNGEDGNQPLGPGEVRELGFGTSQVRLPFQPPAGEESLVAFAVEWNVFEGVNFADFSGTDHVFLQSSIAGRSGQQTQQAMLRSRDIGVERRRARPGEGWDRAVFKIKHQ